MVGTASPRVGIVGLGNIGRYHADRLRQSGRALAGGVDVSRPAREAFAEDFGTDAFGSFEDLYDHGVDAVIVTTPNSFHEEYAVAALERDVPVLVEKPLAHTLASAGRIRSAAESSAAFCTVGFHKRFLNNVEALWDRISAGELGDIHHVDANYVRRRGIPGRGGWFTQESYAGGGALIDIGIHVLDLAMYFLEFPRIGTVDATILSEFGGRDDYTYLEMWGDDQGPDRWDVEDSVRAFLRTPDGTSISLNVAWAANQPDDTTITITGSDGGAKLDHETGELELYTVENVGAPQLLTTRVQTRQEDPHRKEQEAFLSAVASGRPPQRNTVDEGYHIQELVDALYTAGETGRQISLTEAGTSGVTAD